MNYGLALVTELQKNSPSVGVSVGCEYITHAMSLKDSDTKMYMGTFWFETEKDREACVAYADALSTIMSELYSLNPEEMKRW